MQRSVIVSLAVNIALFLMGYTVVGQDSSNKKITTRFYIDAYYSNDFNKNSAGKKADFIYNHNKLNKPNINLALAGINYQTKQTRAALSLMTGTYAKANLAAEPEWLQYVNEASFGFRLSASKELWLDAGIMSSHIGFESSIGKDCWTLSRSILAENSPYYESGFRISYIAENKKWMGAVLVLNGWQRISPVFKNGLPAMGTQWQYYPSKKFTFNWSTFTGTVHQNNQTKQRIFNNWYAVMQWNKYWGLTLGLDYGIQQSKPNASFDAHWFSPVAIVRYEKNKTAIAARAEYYRDKTGAIITLIQAQPFSMQGYSINMDQKLGKHVLWRTECRYLNNSTPYFNQDGNMINSNWNITWAVIFNWEN